MTFMLIPYEMLGYIAKRLQGKRLSLNFSQKSLAERSGVSFGVIKKFERTGKISLESLLKLAQVLGSLEDFQDLFKVREGKYPKTLDELLEDKPRKRGRL